MALCFAAFLLALSPGAVAERRVALVIGNGTYTRVPRLENPKNDAAAIEAMFKAAGFNTVVRSNDLGVAAMRRALREFSDIAHDADIAVVFYAGHGIEVGGVNYLIPIDAALERDIDARDEAIPLDRVNEVLESVKRLRLVILDACRDNPFARSMRRTIATRSVRSGYGEIDERSLPPNTLVAYAQRAGSTAEDGAASSNSPYTSALLKHLLTPGLDVELALRRVRDEVLRATRNRQEPFKYGSLSGAELPLAPANAGPAAVSGNKDKPGEQTAQGEAERAWALVKDSKTAAPLEAFVARFGDTFYGDLAKVRLAELRQADVALKAADKKAQDDARASEEAERKRLALLKDDRKRANNEAEFLLGPRGRPIEPRSETDTSKSIKIAYIDPLSGPGASVGEIGLKTFQFVADELNAKGGAGGKTFEVLAFDNKTNPQESLVQLQKAVDAGARIIVQGNGSSVASAMADWVAKHNERNRGKEVIYLNYAAVDPVLTNDKCSFAHFRWDAGTDIKLEALTNYMKGQARIKKVYLINQDYSFGQAVRSAAVEMLKAKRSDIEIVGDELHPLLKITDFAPYIAKIKASGADTVITGNWNQDLALLLKAAGDAGIQANWLTLYASGIGGPTAVKQAGLDHRVFTIQEGSPNVEHAPSQAAEKAFRDKHNMSILYPRVVTQMRMLAAAVSRSISTDPIAIALALEGMTFDVFNGGSGFMRKKDHQFFQPMYVLSLGARGPKEPFDEEGTGWGWRTIARFEAKDVELPTTCKMSRPY